MTGLFWIYWSQFIWCKKQHFWSSGSRAKGVVVSCFISHVQTWREIYPSEIDKMSYTRLYRKFGTTGSHGNFFLGGAIFFFRKPRKKFIHSLRNSRQNMCRNVEIDFCRVLANVAKYTFTGVIFWPQKLWWRNIFNKFYVCTQLTKSGFRDRSPPKKMK